MPTILKEYPIWVIAYDDGGQGHRTQTGFVRVTSGGTIIKKQSLVECSKWRYKADAFAMLPVDRQEFFVYRVDEYEDGSDRLFVKLTRETR